MIFERTLPSSEIWHEITEEEVRRVFGNNIYKLKVGEKVPSPLGTGVVYRCRENGLIEQKPKV